MPGADDHWLTSPPLARSPRLQKERLWNLGWRHFAESQPECTTFAFVDSDVLFGNDDWAAHSVMAINNGAHLVQPFEFQAEILPDRTPDDDALMANSSVCTGRLMNSKGDVINDYHRQGFIIHSYAHRVEMAKKTIQPCSQLYPWAYLKAGHPGSAWVLSRATLKAIGGLFDKCPSSQCDTLGLRAFSLCVTTGDSKQLLEASLAAYSRMLTTKLGDVKVASVSGVLYHLYHGGCQTRDYGRGHSQVGSGPGRPYNPAEDIFEDPMTGVFRWNCSGAHGVSSMNQGWEAAQRREEDSGKYPDHDWQRCDYKPVVTTLWWAAVAKRARERAGLPPAPPALTIGSQQCMSMVGAAEGTEAPATIHVALAAATAANPAAKDGRSSTPWSMRAWHAIPQLFVLGAQKAGTTTLHAMLHAWWPSSFGRARPLLDEPHYFIKERHAVDSAYDGLMADMVGSLQLQHEWSPGTRASPATSNNTNTNTDTNGTRVRHWPCGPGKSDLPCSAAVHGPASLLWRLVRAYPCVIVCPQCKTACPNTTSDWSKRPDCVRGSFPRRKVAFVDATPNYLADALAPKAMSQLMPHIKPRFLVVVRAPIDRLMSLYKHLVSLPEPTQANHPNSTAQTARRRFLPPQRTTASWGLAASVLATHSTAGGNAPSSWVAGLLSNLDKCVRQLKPAYEQGPRVEGLPLSPNTCTADSIPVVESCLPDANGLGGGLYAVHMLRWLRWFPAESFSLITFNLLVNWPELTAAFLAQQWGLPEPLSKPLRDKNKGKSSQSLDAVQYAALTAFYQPCNAQLLPLLHAAGIHFRVSALDDATFPDPLRAYSFRPKAD